MAMDLQKSANDLLDIENSEWRESLDYVLQTQGEERSASCFACYRSGLRYRVRVSLSPPTRPISTRSPSRNSRVIRATAKWNDASSR